MVGGQSFLDPIFNALRIDPIEGFQISGRHDVQTRRRENEPTCANRSSL